MSNSNTIDVLNRLLAIHARSFPRYLESAPPFVGDLGVGEGETRHAFETLNAIAADQEAMEERIGELILSSGGMLDTGEWQMEFTDLHDLSLAYILRRASAYQRQDIATLSNCVESLRLSPVAHALAEEAVGMAVGHLELLEELSLSKVAS